MRRIRRNPLLFLLAAFTLACEEPREDVARQVPGTPALEDIDPSGAQVVFWYQHTQMREEALLGLIEDFNRTNEHGIRVRGEFAGRYSDIYNKMMVGLQGGELPEIVVAYQNQAVVYDMGEGLVDLSPYMNSPEWGLTSSERDDFVQAFLAQDFIDGKQICFPPNRSLEILYYNADWLREIGEEEPPATWEEFARLCRLARTQPFDAAQPVARSKGYLFEAEASRMATMVFTRGGGFHERGTNRLYPRHSGDAAGPDPRAGADPGGGGGSARRALRRPDRVRPRPGPVHDPLLLRPSVRGQRP